MKTPIRWLLTLAFLPVLLAAAEEKPRISSKVYTWDSLAVKPTGVGERRDVADNPTPTLRTFECHISTLNPNQASHPPHTHPQEELIILRDGTLDVHINGVVTRVGPGSLFFFASNDPHNVRNVGDKPATYFVFNFATAATAPLRNQAPLPAAPGRMGSSIFDWNKLEAKATKTGERRDVTDKPTSTLANFECHITTLKAGEAPHAPHHHPDEEIVLVKEGQMDVTINGVTQRAGPGSVVLITSGDEHGWRNVGDTTATYYVMRLKTEATPLVAAK
ncbi:MAG TPA: cupin domain-containing protein [Lacunisphaera sp.]|nr:cupin domain-containing protein [Lacunisphaera sp.]